MLIIFNFILQLGKELSIILSLDHYSLMDRVEASYSIQLHLYYSKYKMPFKLKVIKQLQNNMRSTRLETLSQTEDQLVPVPKIQPLVTINIKKSKNKKVTQRCYNYFQLIYLKQPAFNHHVVSFYNIIGLNQRAIADPNWEQSKLATIFYIKNVKMVEIRSNVVAIQLCNSSLSFPPIEYIIERYRSFGDQKFYNIANLLETVCLKLKSITQVTINAAIEDTKQEFDKFVEEQGNKMFICRSTNNELVISKALLELLEYNIEEFVIEIVKFKAPLTEIFSTQRYFDIVYQMFSNLKNLFDLINQDIDLESFLSHSMISFKDYLITKNQKKLFCQLNVGMPNPILNIIEVKTLDVISPVQDNNSRSAILKEIIGSAKRTREISEVKTVRQLMHLPKNLLPQNEGRVSSFTTLDEVPQLFY